MRITEVVKKIGIDRLEEFFEFMRGQTIGIDEHGEPDYYEQDVENFLRKPKERFWD